MMNERLGQMWSMPTTVGVTRCVDFEEYSLGGKSLNSIETVPEIVLSWTP
jgi:hypothetical protein